MEVLTEQLKAVQSGYEQGMVSAATYRQTTRRIYRELRALNHQRYGHAMGKCRR